eukprot:TRINITY_DN486_c0_g1_i5.p1 TRINITY_DN486_c0_g1~~TRINITY_DN486_c0_g1_i5.p1  ORF type:complete len:173 (-),score=36.99 TRINITY_DN486_c0_g1_i5:130-648(-)
MESSVEELEKVAAEGERAQAEEVFVEGNLRVLHDDKRCECLNDRPDQPFSNIFKDDDSLCTSDVDEQLLITLAYKDPTSVKSIKFVAPNDGSGPKKVKLFVNLPNMDFSVAEDYRATQEISLKPGQLDLDAKPIVLEAVKFQKTDTLTIFIVSNQGDLEQTSLTRLIVHGSR